MNFNAAINHLEILSSARVDDISPSSDVFIGINIQQRRCIGSAAQRMQNLALHYTADMANSTIVKQKVSYRPVNKLIISPNSYRMKRGLILNAQNLALFLKFILICEEKCGRASQMKLRLRRSFECTICLMFAQDV